MKLLVSLCVVIFACGCITSTKIHSRLNPKYNSRGFTNLLVIAEFADLGLQEKCEGKIKKELQKQGVECTMGHELFFAEKTQSEDEYLEMLDDLGIEAVLIVYPAGAGYSATYIPPRSKTKVKGRIKPDYLGGYKVKVESETRTYGGYNINKPWADFEAEMFDVTTGEMVWYATSSSSGNAFTNYKSLVNAVGGKTVKKLTEDGLISK